MRGRRVSVRGRRIRSTIEREREREGTSHLQFCVLKNEHLRDGRYYPITTRAKEGREAGKRERERERGKEREREGTSHLQFCVL